MKNISIIAILFSLLVKSNPLAAQKIDPFKPVIMLAHVDFREAGIWVMSHTDKGKLEYWDMEDPIVKKIVEITPFKANERYIYVFTTGVLEPGKKYGYQYFDPSDKNRKDQPYLTFKTPELWKWRKPAPDFSIAFGSCNYVNETRFDRPGKAYGDTATDIFNSIVKQNPDLMIWLGDNTYLREPDWGSKAGIYERYIHTRTQANLQKLLQHCPNYAIWDDHDFGPNDADGSFYNKDLTLNAFQDFWPNNNSTINGVNGITTAFDYGDAHFYLLDDRYNRTPDFCDSCKEETILGQEQLSWLKMTLKSASSSEFKIVCLGGQFLNNYKTYECYSNWEHERAEIIEFINEHKIKNVIFLTGDRHFSELSMLKTQKGIRILDFTVSPLSSGVYKDSKEINDLALKGSHYDENRNFGTLSFKGTGKERAFTFRLFDKFGKEVYQYSFIRE
ncbi:MAG: alkaline phosphatase family protein [Flavobacteriales bacterium]|nr:alkaline phosphatase family protein [Flavobacteriales bacterium]